MKSELSVRKLVRTGCVVIITGMIMLIPVSAKAQLCTDNTTHSILGDDAATVAANGTVTIQVDANDQNFGPVGSVNTDNSRAQAQLSGSGSYNIVYTPEPGVGSEIVNFKYSVTFLSDGFPICDIANVVVTIGPIGTIAAADDQVQIEDGSVIDIKVLDNDTGNPDISITSNTPSNNGATISITSGSSISYTPPAVLPDKFTDTFTYTIQGSGPLAGTQDTATVTIMGPDIEPPEPGLIDARNDSLSVNSGQGRVFINVLTNDAGDDLIIDSVNGNVRGRVAVTANKKQIAYDPPSNLTSTITENFSYSISSTSDSSLKISSAPGSSMQSSANVRIRVIGRGESTTDNPSGPLAVSTRSIGMIRSDLPIARAVENLCDLLTFRGDSRTPGGLTAAQQDLQNCACSIVNDSNAGAQRNAISQLSGGQHQFSDTVLRFAKANSSVILKRMAELRQLVTKTISPTLSNLTAPHGSGLAADALPFQHSLPEHADDDWGRSSVDSVDQHIGQPFPDVNNAGSGNTVDPLSGSIFDALSINTSNVYFSAPLGGTAGDSGLFSNRLGVFTSITNGSGNSDDSEFEFDFDSYEIMAGMDYTVPGSKYTRVYGGALSVGKVETDASDGAGNTQADSLGLTLYAMLFGSDGWFMDGTLNYSKSDIDIERVINFTTSGKSVLQSSSGDTQGDEIGLSIGAGKEFNFGANNLRTDIRLQYIDGTIDGLTEQISQVGAPGSGLALQTDDFDIESFRSEIGFQFSRAIGTGFGVVMPYVGATWIHEFEDRGSDIPARFVVDAYSDGFTQLEESAPGGNNRPTLFVIPGSENDSNYARLSLGSSFTFIKGKSAWISVSTVAGLDGIDNTQITGGFRWEFGN